MFIYIIASSYAYTYICAMLADETLEGDHRAWSYAGDGALITNVSRAHVQAGVPNHIVVNDGTGLLSSVAVLNPLRGGLGSSSVPTDGQIPIASGGSYIPAQLTSDGTITITPGPGVVQLSAVGGGGGGGMTRMVISELMWLVSSMDEVTIATMPYRAASWAGAGTRTISFWQEPSRGFTMRTRNHNGVLLGSKVVAWNDVAALQSYVLLPQLTDTVLTFTIQAENTNVKYACKVKGLYLDAA